MGSEAAVPAIKFHLTGFKKFHNVPDNPTETLVKRTMEYMRNNPMPFGATIESCTVLETVGAGALEHLLSLLDDALNRDDIHTVGTPGQGSSIVWIHLGVNSGTTGLAIEQRAVNEATFRCPDEMGWQPDGLPIVEEDGDITHVRETKFPVSKIAGNLLKQGFDVVISNDAGRFVCNYVYYHSLRHAAKHGTRSLFVHVPPFSKISEEKQMELICALLKFLASSACTVF